MGVATKTKEEMAHVNLVLSSFTTYSNYLIISHFTSKLYFYLNGENGKDINLKLLIRDFSGKVFL